MLKRINIFYRCNPSLSLLIFVLMFHLTKIQVLWPPHLRGCPSPAPGQSGQWSRWPQLPNYHHYFEMLGAVTSRRTFTPCQHLDFILSQHLQTSILHGVKEGEKYWSYQIRMSSSILMSSMSSQKYASCSCARGGGWCHYDHLLRMGR